MCRVICTFHYNREYSCEWNSTIFNDDVGSNDDTGTDPAALTNLSWWILWPTEQHRVCDLVILHHTIYKVVWILCKNPVITTSYIRPETFVTCYSSLANTACISIYCSHLVMLNGTNQLIHQVNWVALSCPLQIGARQGFPPPGATDKHCI